MKNTWILLLMTALAFTACKSTKTLTEEGNYDEAIEQALRKLIGKKKKKADIVASLESAFAKATEEDMRRVNQLKAEGRGENWSRVYSLAKKMETRQTEIRPLLPLIDDKGRRANFNFAKTEIIQQEAKAKAASYFYTSSQDLIKQARRGDKEAAREAHERLERIGQYYNNYKNSQSLMNEARDLGVSRILFRMENVSNSVIPRDFEREILRTDVQDLNELWREYYTRDAGEDFDYEIVMKLQDIDVSPEGERIREFREEKEIEDGEEALRDENGNIQRDTSGNVIKVPVKKWINADVIETYQTKSAIVGGTLLFYNKKKRELMDTKPLSVEAIFEHATARFQGDRRALSSGVRNNLNNRPVPFPPDANLLLDAADLLKPLIKDQIALANFF